MAKTVKKSVSTKKSTAAVKKTTASTKVAKTVEVKEVVEGKKSLSAKVVGVDGKAAGTVSLPAELFDVVVNKSLLAQSVRVYLANQRSGSAQVKTRGEVEGSTRKIYKQKGTGRARHGSIRAPIFVGGGVVFGPETRDYSLKLSKKMKQAALASVLTAKYHDGTIMFVDGMGSLPPKTKAVAAALGALEVRGSILLVISKDENNLVRSARNIEGVDVMPVSYIHPYGLMTHKKVIFTKTAVSEVKNRLTSTS